jgi:hypothetical protein
MKKPYCKASRVASGLTLFALLVLASSLHAQQTPPPATPSNPPAKTDQSQQDDTARKNDRIFGVMPNYATVEGAKNITPIHAKEKFKLAIEGSFDPYEFALVSLVAAKDQAENDNPPWGQGWAAYGKRYGADFANQAIGNVMVGGVFPSILRQDPRYFQMGKGTFLHRFFYSLSRIVVTRTDSGHSQFNVSEFAGNAAATGISNLYSPAQSRTFDSNVGTFGTQIFLDAFGNELKEFWPDIRRKLFKKN